MTLQLDAVDVVDTIEREQFVRAYVNPGKPLVIKQFARHWGAWNKWRAAYFEEKLGDMPVVVNSKDVKATGFYGHHGGLQQMTMRNFLHAVLDEERDLRFAARHTTNVVPLVADDFDYPALGQGYAPGMTWMFFGCKGSRTPLHYDFDCFHVFHACFVGRKTFYLFDQTQNKNIHQAWPTARSPVDPQHPDYAQWPRLADATGYCVTLEPGDTLYIPAAMWHEVRYHDGSISLTVRFTEKKPFIMARVLLSVVIGAINDRLERMAPETWPKMRKRWFGA
jgi:hypothetical protein